MFRVSDIPLPHISSLTQTINLSLTLTPTIILTLLTLTLLTSLLTLTRPSGVGVMSEGRIFKGTVHFPILQ